MPQTKSIVHMTNSEAVYHLSEGLPGAIVAIAHMIKNSTTIDPDAWAGSFHPLLELENLGIKGTQIHAFAKHVCSFNLVTTFAMFRATQLGFLPRDELLQAIREERPVENCSTLVAMVKERLPAFGHFSSTVQG